MVTEVGYVYFAVTDRNVVWVFQVPVSRSRLSESIAKSTVFVPYANPVVVVVRNECIAVGSEFDPCWFVEARHGSGGNLPVQIPTVLRATLRKNAVQSD